MPEFWCLTGARSDVKDGLYTYARFLDLKDRGFSECWLVTNTKATSELIAYGQCAGLKVISWNYPDDMSVRSMVSQRDLHPVTILNSLNDSQKQELLRNDIVFCSELLETKLNILSKEVMEKARKEAQLII